MKIGLGTAQFGMDYGISNPGGRVATDEAARILARAELAGVRVLDTAAAYDAAEERLGELLPTAHDFAIVTKLPPSAADVARSDAGTWVRDAIERSLRRLRQQHVYAVLVHRAEALLGAAGREIWKALEDVQAAGTVTKIGASVYTAAEIDALLNRYPIGLVQVPLNVLDQRLVHSGHLARLQALGVEVHARSVFLQGALLMDPDALPSPHFDAVRETVRSFRSTARSAGVSPLQAAVAYVLGVDGVDTAVVGATRESELEEILVAAETAATIGMPTDWFAPFASDDERILNPAAWPR